MKKYLIVAAWVIGIGIGWDLIARANVKTDEQTQAVVMGILIARTCPDIPEAFSKARSDLIWHAIKRPYAMPPWWVAKILTTRTNAEPLTDNPFPAMLCNGLLGK